MLFRKQLAELICCSVYAAILTCLFPCNEMGGRVRSRFRDLSHLRANLVSKRSSAKINWPVPHARGGEGGRETPLFGICTTLFERRFIRYESFRLATCTRLPAPETRVIGYVPRLNATLLNSEHPSRGLPYEKRMREEERFSRDTPGQSGDARYVSENGGQIIACR